MNIKEKISKIIAFIENETHLKFKVQSEYTVCIIIKNNANSHINGNPVLEDV